MVCDCDPADLIHVKMVKVAKAHRCCECGQAIAPGEIAEKLDTLSSGKWWHEYTCEDCYQITRYAVFMGVLVDCCTGLLYETLANEGYTYDPFMHGVRPKGPCTPIASMVPWLTWRIGGKFRLAKGYRPPDLPAEK